MSTWVPAGMATTTGGSPPPGTTTTASMCRRPTFTDSATVPCSGVAAASDRAGWRPELLASSMAPAASRATRITRAVPRLRAVRRRIRCRRRSAHRSRISGGGQSERGGRSSSEEDSKGVSFRDFSWAAASGSTSRVTGTRSRALPVQPELPDVGLDALGDQVPDGLALQHSPADVRGGDGQGGHVQDRDLGMADGRLLFEPGDVVPRPGGRDEVGEAQDLSRVLPVQDLEHGVGSGYEEQLDVFLGLAPQLLKGVHGVGGPLALDLDPGDPESGVAGGGD